MKESTQQAAGEGKDGQEELSEGSASAGVELQNDRSIFVNWRYICNKMVTIKIKISKQE